MFRRTSEVWNLILWSSSKEELFHPECGTITVFVKVERASRMIVIFTASHDDKFQRTPTGRNCKWDSPEILSFKTEAIMWALTNTNLSCSSPLPPRSVPHLQLAWAGPVVSAAHTHTSFDDVYQPQGSLSRFRAPIIYWGDNCELCKAK